jgi:hypothetical protein
MRADEKMPEEFYDWLDKCPVQWFREKVTDVELYYMFVVPDEEDDEDEEV